MVDSNLIFLQICQTLAARTYSRIQGSLQPERTKAVKYYKATKKVKASCFAAFFSEKKGEHRKGS